MGVAAYQRGSQVIARSIQADFMENRGGYSRELSSQMERAEQKVIGLEQFCRDAQSLYIDATDPSSATGLLKGWMYDVWLKKNKTKRFAQMLDECNDAHCAWVDSDHRHVFNHLAVCQRKAKAWFNVITLLNANSAIYPFPIPAALQP